MKSPITLLFCSLFLFLCFQPEAYSQRHRKKITERFKAGPIIGFSLSQIDGDRFTGFNKLNFIGGLSVEAVLTHQLGLNIELIYNTKGAKIEASVQDVRFERKTRTINLSYMEVPILLNVKMEKKENSPFLEIGGSFARLISSQITEERTNASDFVSFKVLEDGFSTNEISVIVGLGYNITPNFRLKARISAALTNFYKIDNLPQAAKDSVNPNAIVFDELEFFRNYLIGFMGSYYF